MDGYIERQTLQDIADAIREKNGSSDTYKPSEMAEAILDLSGSVNLQDKSVTITENGTQTIVADEGFDGLSSVEVNANVAPPFGLIGWDANDISYYNARLAENIAYSKTLYDAWDASRTSSALLYNNDYKLFYAPHIDTRNVTNMHQMFQSCIHLSFIPQLDTSKVTNMQKMFEGCGLLVAIPQLDTSKVTNMQKMFEGCSSFITIPQLDTSKVTNMQRLFHTCSALKTIPLLDTSSVKNIGWMFYGCRKLTTIPQLDTSEVTDMQQTFNSCSALKTIPLLDTSNVTSLSLAFNNCPNLTNLGGFVNCKVALNLSASTKLTHDSLMNVINNLYDLASNGLATKTLTLGTTNLAKLTEEEQAIAVNKGWTLA